MKKYLWIIILIAFFLRIYQLGARDFWFDETVSVFIAKDVLSNWNPPLYYFFLHYWIKLFGVSEFSLRFPSMLFSIFSILLIFILGKKIFNYKVGLYSAVLMTFSPFHIWYAQEARPYSLAVLVGLLSSYSLYIIFTEKKGMGWYYFIFFSIIGLYVSYFYAVMIIFQSIYLVVHFWRVKNFVNKKYFSLLILIPFGFILWFPKLIDNFLWIKKGFWVPLPNVKSLFITLENFLLGYNVSQSTYIISDILVFFLLGKVFWYIMKNRKLIQNFSFCFSHFLVPIVSIFIFSKTIFPIYLDRALILFSPYYYLALSLALTSINNKKIKSFLSLFILGLLFYGLFSFYSDWMSTGLTHHVGVHLKKPIKPVIKFMKNNLRPEDKIAFTNISIVPSYFFYSKEELVSFTKRHFFLFIPGIKDDYFQFSGIPRHNYFIPIQKLNEIEFERLWVIYSSWARNGNLDKNSLRVKEHLSKILTLSLIKEFDGIEIFRYERNRQ